VTNGHRLLSFGKSRQAKYYWFGQKKATTAKLEKSNTGPIQPERSRDSIGPLKMLV
jgi:hypothetical protein